MKVIVAVMLFALPFFAFADDMENGFKDHKAHEIKMIEERIAALNQTKSCLEGANDQAAVKKCNEAAKAEREKMEAEHKAERAKNIDQRIQKLQEEKAKMNEKK